MFILSAIISSWPSVSTDNVIFFRLCVIVNVMALSTCIVVRGSS